MPRWLPVDLSAPQRRLGVGLAAVILVTVPLFWYLAARSPNIQQSPRVSGVTHGTYATSFPLAEGPISEGGNWKNGAADGIDWTNCRTTPGLVFGAESGTNSNSYDDSTCILAGTWGPLQTVQATVFSQNQSGACFQEVELRLHSTMTAHSSTGYEVLFRAYHPGGYTTIVRWNGALGKFTYLNQKAEGSYHGIRTGDLVKATIDGNGLIIGYVNGVEVIRATDRTYTGGNPGMGFWLLARNGQGNGTNANYGFSAFTATDESTTANFATSVAPTSRAVTAGNSAIYTVNVVPSRGFTGMVSLSASGQPSGATASFSPSSIITPGSSTLTVTTATSTPVAIYPLTITGTSGSLTQTAAVTLTVKRLRTSLHHLPI
jgi:hypothetical protein